MRGVMVPQATVVRFAGATETAGAVSELRILVVDDHRVFAGALATVIDAQPDITVVGTSDSVEAAERDTNALDPDVVVLDVDLGGQDGIELARRLRERDPLLR